MKVMRLGGASAIAKRMLISAIIIALVMASCIAPVFAENLPATNDAVRLDSISDKAPGDTVTITGTTTFPEITIKVLNPNKTILYVSTVAGGNFTNTFTLPKDAKPGTYEVVAGEGTTVATATFKVEEREVPPTIVSIDEVSVTTKVGTEPVLPKEVTARYSDGSSRNVAVVWDEIDPSKYAKAGIFTVEGTVEGTDIKAKATVTVAPVSVDEVKLDNIPDKVPGDTVTVSGTTTFGEITIKVIAPNKTVLYVVTVKGGNFTKTFTLPKDAKPGIYEVVAGVGSIVATTTFKVEEELPPTIVSIDEVSVTTKAGTAPVLPKEVTARYSDGSSKNVAVVWDEIDPTKYAKAGIFTVEGTVEGTNIKAKATVTVVEEELPPTIVSIDEVSVTTKAGIAPVLPKEVTARYSDGSSRNVAVVWDEIDPSKYAKAGTFTVEGTVEGTDIKAKATVTVAPVSVDEVKLDNIPDKVPGDTVTISGTTTFGEITIKVIAPNKTVLYVATVKGGNFTKTFTLPKDAKPGIYEVVAGVGSIVATTTFKVVEDDVPPTIISIGEVSVTTKAGIAPVLPKEVTARYSDGSSRNVAVVWDEIDPSKYAKAGTFTVEGTVEGTSIKAIATVTVVEDDVPPTIISIGEVSVTTKAGTAPVLPKEVTARYSDGSSRNVAVVWDEIDPSKYAKAGTFTVEGTVEGTSIKAIATVTVVEDDVPPTIISIGEVSVTTKAGIAPVLPKEVTARYSDGSSRNVAVVWDEIDPSKYAKKGTFTVEGTVEGTSIKAIATVTVVEDDVPPTIVSIDEVYVTTRVRTAPVLPKEVTVRYSDGSSRKVAVVWDEIDPSKYAKKGTFTVEGTVEGTDIKAIATVRVRTAGGGSSDVAPVEPEDDSTEIKAEHEVDVRYTAKFGKGALRRAIKEAEDGIARLKITETEEAGEVLVNIPAEDLELAIEKGIKTIEIQLDDVVFTINPEILINSKGEYPSNIDLSIKKVDVSTLPEEVRNVVGNSTVYDLGLSIDGEKINFNKGDVIVSMKYTLKPGEDPNKVVVYYIDDNDNIKVVTNGRYNPETGRVDFKPEHLSMYAAVYNDVAFSDISSVPWAQEAIEYLAARGVISGPGDGTFRPNDNVTRAEFIKMLMMALELEDEEAVCTFSDVKKGAWYYRPIATAEKLGIVKGKGDGTFGVNDEILRQDMAVMIYRTAQLLGIDLGDDINVETFTDEAEISGYAKEAVAAMQKAGIIKGTGDGSFAPRNNATRAEAAVIIYRLLKMVK